VQGTITQNEAVYNVACNPYWGTNCHSWGNCGSQWKIVEKETSIRTTSDQSDQKKFNVAVEKNASLAGNSHRIVFTLAE